MGVCLATGIALAGMLGGEGPVDAGCSLPSLNSPLSATSLHPSLPHALHSSFRRFQPGSLEGSRGGGCSLILIRGWKWRWGLEGGWLHLALSLCVPQGLPSARPYLPLQKPSRSSINSTEGSKVFDPSPQLPRKVLPPAVVACLFIHSFLHFVAENPCSSP